MDLTNITANQPQLFEQPAVAAQTGELGREDFLRMLIAQLEHQDPLDPQDASEFTAQLATFSSLDQLVSMRQAIDSLAATSGVADGLAAAGLIGRDVLVETGQLPVDAESEVPGVTLELHGAAQVLSVEIVDSAGRAVATASQLGLLGSGQHELAWSDFDARPQPGLYDLRVTAAQGDPTPTTLVRSTVTGAALDASGTLLLLGDAEVPASALREIGNGPPRSL